MRRALLVVVALHNDEQSCAFKSIQQAKNYLSGVHNAFQKVGKDKHIVP